MKCKAHKTNGKPCQADAIKGAVVCRVHGGMAPQVREAARHRLLMAADEVAGVLVSQALGKGKYKKIEAGEQCRAVVALLDRAGLKPTDKMELSVPEGIGVAVIDVTNLTDEQLAAVKAAQVALLAAGALGKVN